MPWFGVGYFKGEPTEYLLVYRGGALSAKGVGLTFFYWAPSTTIVAVPSGTIDVPFILNEMTGNYQAVTLQGQLTYRLTKPETVAAVLNYAIDPATRQYRAEDPEKLAQRIINEVQTQARGELQNLALDAVMRQSVECAQRMYSRVKAAPALAELGIELVSLYLTSVKPTPEMAKALEAEYRENLQTKADQAIYQRRALAVEQERRIKDNELTTAIELEQKRQHLVQLEGENAIRQAEAEAKATAIKLGPYKELPPATLLAMSMKGMADNAGKIGNLTITPELMASLLPK